MRAVIKLARRSLRLGWRRHLVVMVLIGLPVAAGVLASTALRTHDVFHGARFEERFGSADFAVYIESSNGANDPVFVGLANSSANTMIEASIGQDFRYLTEHPTEHDRQLSDIRVTDLDLESPMVEPLVKRVDGTVPRTEGQVALTADFANALGLKPGDSISFTNTTTATVSGVVHLEHESEWRLYVPVGSLNGSPNTTLEHDFNKTQVIWVSGLAPAEFVDLGIWTSDLSQPYLQRLQQYDPYFGGQLLEYPNGQFADRPEVAGSLLTGALMVEAALLAAVAFAISARRRTIEFGRLVALGAGPSQVRNLLLTEAALLAFSAGTIATIAVVVATRNFPQLITYGPESMPVRNEWADLVVPVTIATVGAVTAAWVPARRAARMSAMSALADAVPQSPLPANSLIIALALLGLGVAGVVGQFRYTVDAGGGQWLLTLVLAVGLVVAGLVVFIAWLVDRIPTAGSFGGVMARVAVRYSSRHRLRTTAAISAMTLTVLIAVMSVALVGSGDRNYEYQEVKIDDRRYGLVSSYWGQWVDPARPSVSDIKPEDRLDGVKVVAVSSFGDFDDYRSQESNECCLFRVNYSEQPEPDGPRAEKYGEQGLVVDNEAIAVLDLPADVSEALLRPDTVVLLSDPAGVDSISVYHSLEGGTSAATSTWDVAPVDLPGFDGWEYVFLVSETNAEAAGHSSDVVDFVIVPPDGHESFSLQQQLYLDRRGVRFPTVYEAVPDGVWYPLELWWLAGLLVGGLTLYRLIAALMASEADRDASIMMAVGAPAHSRQRLLGVQAGLHLGIACALGAVGGLLLAYCLIAVDPYRDESITIPWVLLTGVLAMPMLGYFFVRYTSRSAAPAVSVRIN